VRLLVQRPIFGHFRIGFRIGPVTFGIFLMRKFLLTGVATLACVSSAAYTQDEPPEDAPPPPTVNGPLSPVNAPPPLGWVFTQYTSCPEPRICPIVYASVPADGLNVRAVPNGPPIVSVVNGTPLLVLQRQGQWTLVAPACDLTPTWAWSWNAGVSLMRCWVYW
jgi:hypothetical protein